MWPTLDALTHPASIRARHEALLSGDLTQDRSPNLPPAGMEARTMTTDRDIRDRLRSRIQDFTGDADEHPVTALCRLVPVPDGVEESEWLHEHGYLILSVGEIELTEKGRTLIEAEGRRRNQPS
jgi:hypothetical protein